MLTTEKCESLIGRSRKSYKQDDTLVKFSLHCPEFKTDLDLDLRSEVINVNTTHASGRDRYTEFCSSIDSPALHISAQHTDLWLQNEKKMELENTPDDQKIVGRINHIPLTR